MISSAIRNHRRCDVVFVLDGGTVDGVVDMDDSDADDTAVLVHSKLV